MDSIREPYAKVECILLKTILKKKKVLLSRTRTRVQIDRDGQKKIGINYVDEAMR